MGGAPGRTAEVLTLARVSVVAPEETYALFASTAQSFTSPQDPARVPTDFELAVCRLPEEVISRLAEGPDSARHVLEPFVKATEAGRMPPGAGLLEIGCLLAPREFSERVVRAYAPERREDAILRVVAHSRAARGYWGHRWTAYVALKKGVVPRPWRIISGYEGPDAARPIQAPPLLEADERVTSIHDGVRSSDQLSRIADCSAAYTLAHHSRVVHWCLVHPGQCLP